LFAYQTLDAIDGKQARRTGTDNPLEQLFDHGADSFTTGVFAIILCCALKMGTASLSLTFVINWTFFLASWEEYHTHKMRTFIGYIGITEGQLGQILVLILAGIFGPEFYDMNSHQLNPSLPYIEIRYLVIASLLFGSIQYGYSNVVQVLKHSKYGLRAFLHLIPLLTITVLSYFWCYTKFYYTHTAIVVLITSVSFSYLTIISIICDMTQMTYPIFQWETLLVLPVFINEELPKLLSGSKNKEALIPEGWLVLIISAIILYRFSSFMNGVLTQICETLEIYCFSPDKRKKQ